MIEFIKTERECAHNEAIHKNGGRKRNGISGKLEKGIIYDYLVLIDGEHRATFKPLYMKTGYELCVAVSFHHPVTTARGQRIHAKARSGFEFVIKTCLEDGIIPTIKEIEGICSEHAAEVGRLKASKKADALLSEQKAKAPDMFDLLGLIAANCFNRTEAAKRAASMIEEINRKTEVE